MGNVFLACIYIILGSLSPELAQSSTEQGLLTSSETGKKIAESIRGNRRVGEKWKSQSQICYEESQALITVIDKLAP